jgi:hypothetical protein
MRSADPRSRRWAGVDSRPGRYASFAMSAGRHSRRARVAGMPIQWASPPCSPWHRDPHLGGSSRLSVDSRAPAGIVSSKVPGDRGHTDGAAKAAARSLAIPFDATLGRERGADGLQMQECVGLADGRDVCGKEGGPARESGVSDEISVRGRPTYWPDAKRLLTSRACSRAQGIEWLRRIHR